MALQKVNGETGMSDGRLTAVVDGVTIPLLTPEEFNWAIGGSIGHMMGTDGLPYAITRGKFEPTFDFPVGQEEGLALLEQMNTAGAGTTAAINKEFSLQLTFRREGKALTEINFGRCKLEDISQALKTGEGNRIPLKGKFLDLKIRNNGGAEFNPMQAANG